MNFSELGLTKRVVADLQTLGFTEPTEIQAKTIPSILAGLDIMASAETGSGKTAAYGLPIVQSLRGRSERMPRALVLVPTRELAVQVNDELIRFSSGCGIRTVTIYGGVGFDKQIRQLRRGVDVIVATPGRLFDHIRQGTADLRNIKILVLDEADRMLDMGFTPQVRQIVSELNSARQTIMFSATINKAVEKTSEEFLKDPVNVCVNSERVEPASIDQQLHFVQEDGKDQLLVQLISEQPEPRTVLVFTRTRHRASKVCKRLNAAQITAGEIHSDISQKKRELTLKQFRDGEVSVLVATDIAARGLDIPAISHVVNFDLPLSAADYVHRIGRTGRAGRSGTAVSFVSEEQRYLIRDIEKVTGRTLDPDSPFNSSRSHKDKSDKSRANRNRSRSNRFRRDRQDSRGPESHRQDGHRTDSHRTDSHRADSHRTDSRRADSRQADFRRADTRRPTRPEDREQQTRNDTRRPQSSDYSDSPSRPTGPKAGFNRFDRFKKKSDSSNQDKPFQPRGFRNREQRSKHQKSHRSG